MKADKRRAGRAIRKRRRTARGLAAFARHAGITLHPWQIHYLTAWLHGEHPVIARARRGGKATVAEVAERVVATRTRGATIDRVSVDEVRGGAVRS
jgi:hypothetical protein